MDNLDSNILFELKTNIYHFVFRLPILFLCILLISSCSSGINQTSNENSSISLDGISSLSPSGNLIPVLAFNYGEGMQIIDYEKGMLTLQNGNPPSLSTKYLVADFTVFNLISLNKIGSVSDDNCILASGAFISDHLYVKNCIPAQNAYQDYNGAVFQVWDLDRQAMVNNILTNNLFSSILPSPDQKMFVVSDEHGVCAHLFNSTTLQEMPLANDCLFTGNLSPSPDGKYFVAEDPNSDTLLTSFWKWTDSGPEQIFQLPSGYSYGASISSDGHYIAYNTGDGISVMDLISSKEVNKIKTNFQAFFSTAISADSSKLFVSAEEMESSNYKIYVFDIKSGQLVNTIGSYTDIPHSMRILYLPQGIRNSWDWSAYPLN